MGSKYKIDALYLSPSITIINKIQQLCEDVYGTSIIMTEEFKHCLSSTSLMLNFTRPPPEDDLEGEPFKVSMQSLRMIDKVFLKARGIPIELYSFDVKIPEADIVPPEDHQLGDIIVTPEMEEFVDIEKVQKFPLSYMYTADEDVYTLQKHRANNDFYLEYNEAMEAYIDGEWDYAVEALDKCLLIDPDDGPAKEIKRFIKEENNGKVPERWMGYRNVSFLGIANL